MRAVYQSADHPERMRLVFTTQLHHQLQTIARGREIHTPTPPPRHANGYASTRGREIDGWELEKKVLQLKEVRPLLERPFFLYSDANTTATHSSSGGSSGVAAFFSLDLYFNKTLPLVTGQQSLLDLWEYLLDMCEYVPVRNRCRSLYLHVAVCVCRRVEFIHGYTIDDLVVTIDETVLDRYYHLLGRCIDLCNTKLTQSRVLLEENALFMAHIYTTVSMRFPSRAGSVFDAVVESTRVLEDRSMHKPLDYRRPERQRSQSEPNTMHSIPPSGSSPVTGKKMKEREQCRSPREMQRNWNALPELAAPGNEIDTEEQTTKVLSAFSKYQKNRRAHATLYRENKIGNQHISTVFNRRTVESALCEALEADMTQGEVMGLEEVAFIQQVPALRVFGGSENKRLLQYPQLLKGLELGLDLFTERLQKPARDEVLLAFFIGAFLGDYSYWCEAGFAATTMSNSANQMLWHCIPGYFCVIRAFVAIFKRMCQRRPRQVSSSNAGGGSILSIVHSQETDAWSSYWSTREVTVVMDTLSEVAKNPRLTNIFVEIVLEGTNILDPTSVNYALSNLQRVLETAASSSRRQNNPHSTLTSKRGRTSRKRGSLGNEFDDVYFCTALRKAMLSSHVQILLKSLTFLYSCLDLLPSRARRRIISELVIRENFFRLFLHWNEEIRKIYVYMIVFKVFASSRLDLPCATDRILLSESPFFHSHIGGRGSGVSALFSPASSSPTFGYWSHFSDIAHSMIKTPSSEAKDEQRRIAAANGLANLVAWDSRGATLANHSGSQPGLWDKRASVFHVGLDDDDVSVDLLVASKIDASMKMLADQVSHKKVPSAQYFPTEQEAYAERALSQYVNVLWEYYAAAFDRPESKPAAPKLEFNISSPFVAE